MSMGMRKAHFLLSILLITVWVKSPTVWGRETLRLGHGFPPESHVGKGVEDYAEQVKNRSGGKMIVKVFPGGLLGSHRELMDQTQFGEIDMAVISTRLLAQNIERLAILELPFLFSSYEEVDRFIDGKQGETLLAITSETGVEGLCYFELGLAGIASKMRAVRKPEDYRGLKITFNSPAMTDASLRLLGASPIRLPAGELYVALQRGMVDATLATIAGYSFYRFDEILPFLSLTNHYYSSYILIMNGDRLKKLEPAFQEILRNAAKDAAVFQRKLSRRFEEKILTNLEEKGVHVERQPDRESMREMVQSIYVSLKNRLGCRECKIFPWCCL